jgi:uncharacterized protein
LNDRGIELPHLILRRSPDFKRYDRHELMIAHDQKRNIRRSTSLLSCRAPQKKAARTTGAPLGYPPPASPQISVASPWLGGSMLGVVAFVVAMLATLTTVSAANFDCPPFLRNGACPQSVICAVARLSTLEDQVGTVYQRLLHQSVGATADRLKSDQRSWLVSRNACGCDPSCIERAYQRRAKDLEHVKADSLHLQASLPPAATGVWGFSEVACELYHARRADGELSDAGTTGGGIINITNSNIRWMNRGAGFCVIATDKISTSQLSISFPAECAAKGRESGQFVIINMHGADSMRLSFLAKRPFFNAEEYVRCSMSQTTPLSTLQEPREVKQLALHQKRRQQRKWHGGCQRERKAMRFARNAGSGPRQGSKSTKKYNAKLRKSLAQVSWSEVISKGLNNFSQALFSTSQF